MIKSLFSILSILSIFSACSVPKYYISSKRAPNFGEVIPKNRIENYLDSLEIPNERRFYAVLDSIPNRSQLTPVGLLFKNDGTFINYRLCNAHYKNLNETINRFDQPKFYFKSYSIEKEMKAVEALNRDILEKYKSSHYLFFFWTLSADNLHARNISNLEKESVDGENYTVFYINIDNVPEFTLSSEQFLSYIETNRTRIQDRDVLTWFDD